MRLWPATLRIFHLIESGHVGPGRNKDQSEQDIMTGYRDRAGHQAIVTHLLWDINRMDWLGNRFEFRMGMDWLENCVEWLNDNTVSFLLFAGHSLRVLEKEANPYWDFSSTTILYNIFPDMFLCHVESFLQAALPLAWLPVQGDFSQGWWFWSLDTLDVKSVTAMVRSTRKVLLVAAAAAALCTVKMTFVPGPLGRSGAMTAGAAAGT